MSEFEKKSAVVPALTASTEKKEVVVLRAQPGAPSRPVRSSFTFDHVLSSFSTQDEVFAATLQPLVQDVLAGYEAAAFAYGQTGTGKTYTMEGNIDRVDDRGLVPRATAAVIRAASSGRCASVQITASCLEIYNEELTDLLCEGTPARMDLMETPTGLRCSGLSEMPVATVDDVQELIRRAQERRRVAETRVNARSSRSHCLFTLRVHSRYRVSGGEVEHVGKLHLVDLAGSECAKKAASIELARHVGSVEAERERRNINQSLLTLGRVITALRAENGRVPYRDSKLTRLLQDALGGSCRTVMIATVSPSAAAIDETISTLTYAEQAMGIINKPLQASVFHFPRSASASLGSDCTVAGVNSGGPSHIPDGSDVECRLAYLVQEVEEAQFAVERKHRDVLDLGRQLEDAEARCSASAVQLEETQQVLSEQRYVLKCTTHFADQRAADAQTLKVSLTAAAARGEGLVERLANRAMAATGMREQVRELCDKNGERTVMLTAAFHEKAASATAALEEEQQEALQALDAFTEVAAAQQALLCGFVEAARGDVRRLSEALGTAGTCASEASAVERTSILAHVATVEEALACGVAASVDGQAAAGDLFGRWEVQLREQIAVLRARLSSEADELCTASRDAAANLGEARGSAAAAEEAARRHLSEAVRGPAVETGCSARSAAEDLRSHGEALSAVRSEGESEVAASANRRAQLTQEQSHLSGVLTAVAATRPTPILQALEACGVAVAAGEATLQDSLQSLSACVGKVHESVGAAGMRGEAAVRDTLGSADEVMLAGLQAGSHQLFEMRMALDCGDTETTECLDASSAVKPPLTQLLSKSITILDSSREASAREVASLRQQRLEEQRIIELLGAQRQALESNIAEAQAKLADVKADLEASQLSMKQSEARQAQRREEAVRAVVDGVESLLRGELGALGEQLAADSLESSRRLEAAAEHVGCASSRTRAAEEHAAAANETVAQAVSALASSIDVSCNAICSAEAQTAEVIQILRADASDTVRNLVATVDVASETQATLTPCWLSAKDKSLTAVADWLQDEQSSLSLLPESQSHAASALTDVERVRAEVSQQCLSAQRYATEWAHEDADHAAAAAQLVSMHEDHCKLDSAASTCHDQALELVVGGSEAILQSVARIEPRLLDVVAAVDAHTEAAAQDGQVQQTAFLAAAGAMEAVACQATTSAATSGEELALQLQSASGAFAAQAQLRLSEATEATEAASTRALEATGQQRAALDSSASASEARWQGLADEQDPILLAADASAVQALEAGAAAALQGQGHVHRELERAATAQQRRASEVAGQSAALAAALGEQQSSWTTGLAKEPMAAFSEDADLAADISYLSEPFEPPAMDLGNRPCHKDLIREFRSGQRSARSPKPGKVADALDENSPIKANRPATQEVPRPLKALTLRQGVTKVSSGLA